MLLKWRKAMPQLSYYSMVYSHLPTHGSAITEQKLLHLYLQELDMMFGLETIEETNIQEITLV
jgi:hypothetical protein